jgi:hypothetical protein
MLSFSDRLKVFVAVKTPEVDFPPHSTYVMEFVGCSPKNASASAFVTFELM